MDKKPLLQGEGEFFFGGQVGEDLGTTVYGYGSGSLEELYQNLVHAGIKVTKISDVPGGPIRISKVERREESPDILRFTLPLKQGSKARLTFRGKRKIDDPPHFVWGEWFLRVV